MTDWHDYAHGDGLGDAFWDAAAPFVMHALCGLRHEGQVRCEIGRTYHPAAVTARLVVDAIIQIPACEAGLGSTATDVLRLRAIRILDRVCRRAGYSPDPLLDELGERRDRRDGARLGRPVDTVSMRAVDRLERLVRLSCDTIVDVPVRDDDPHRGLDRLTAPGRVR